MNVKLVKQRFDHFFKDFFDLIFLSLTVSLSLFLLFSGCLPKCYHLTGIKYEFSIKRCVQLLQQLWSFDIKSTSVSFAEATVIVLSSIYSQCILSFIIPYRASLGTKSSPNFFSFCLMVFSYIFLANISFVYFNFVPQIWRQSNIRKGFTICVLLTFNSCYEAYLSVNIGF